jgi:hypothetical protein
MNTFRKTLITLAIGVTTVAAQAQQVIVIEGQREIVDPSALIGEDSGSFYLARQAATAAPPRAAEPADMRRSAMAAALVSEDSGSAYFASLPLGPGLDRAVVLAELDQARASGELAALVSEDSGSAWLARRQGAATTASITAAAGAARGPARKTAAMVAATSR